LLGAGWTADRIMIVIACGGLIAAVFVVLFRAWFVRQKVRLSGDDASTRAPLRS
jgi:hypothetical protein